MHIRISVLDTNFYPYGSAQIPLLPGVADLALDKRNLGLCKSISIPMVPLLPGVADLAPDKR